jgi:hypothetical protein
MMQEIFLIMSVVLLSLHLSTLKKSAWPTIVLDVQSVDDVEPYRVARFIDSDDNCPIRHLI